MADIVQKLRANANRVLDDVREGKTEQGDYSTAQTLFRQYLKDPDSVMCPDHKYAFELFDNPRKREIIEGLLLADANFEDVEIVFGVNSVVLSVYENMFFNRDEFLTKLDIYEYASTYPDKFGCDLKTRAYYIGADYIYYKYGNVIPKTEQQRNIVKRMFLTSAYRAMEANFNTMTSDVTKESLAWSKHMLDAYSAIEKLMGDDGTTRTLDKYIMERTLDPLDGSESYDPDMPPGELA